jgi:hypothetical protein
LVFALLVSGCTLKFEGRPVVDAPAPSERVARSVGIFYSREFREYKHVESDPSGTIEFELGSGSVALFDSVFDALFDSTSTVNTAELAVDDWIGIDHVLSPSIRRFEFDFGVKRAGYYVDVNIEYGFTLYGRDGRVIDNWTIKGHGLTVRGQNADFDGATSLAMEDAARNFVRGFRQVAEKHWGPEVFRYTTVAEAPRIAKRADLPTGFGPDAVTGMYADAATVIADPYVEPGRQATAFPSLDLRAAQVVPIRVHVRNDGPHRLETHRSSIVARLADGTEVRQLDDDALRALMTPYRGRWFGGPFGPGVGMLPVLFAGLANVAEAEAEAEAGRTGVAALDVRAFEVATLDQGDVADGFVYFWRGGFRGSVREATLVVPVADIEAKKVYSAEIPLRGPAQEFTPYRMN